MSIHKKMKQNNNNKNFIIHTRQKSKNTSAIWVNF